MSPEDKLDQLLIDTAVLRQQVVSLRSVVSPQLREHERRIRGLEAKWLRLGGIVVGLGLVSPELWDWVQQVTQ